MEPRFLTLEEIEDLHVSQIDMFGGTQGIRDKHALRSAVDMPRAGSIEGYFHADVFEMAAAYLFHIVGNHPFLDGNKRTGFFAAYQFLGLNGYDLDIDEDDAYVLVIRVAEGRVAKMQVTDALRANSTPIQTDRENES